MEFPACLHHKEPCASVTDALTQHMLWSCTGPVARWRPLVSDPGKAVRACPTTTHITSPASPTSPASRTHLELHPRRDGGVAGGVVGADLRQQRGCSVPHRPVVLCMRKQGEVAEQ